MYLNVPLRLKSRTREEFTLENPVLLSGEQAFETDTKRVKIGDGVTQYNSLEYSFDRDILDFVKDAGFDGDETNLKDQLQSALPIVTVNDVEDLPSGNQIILLEIDEEEIEINGEVYTKDETLLYLKDFNSSQFRVKRMSSDLSVEKIKDLYPKIGNELKIINFKDLTLPEFMLPNQPEIIDLSQLNQANLAKQENNIIEFTQNEIGVQAFNKGSDQNGRIIQCFDIKEFPSSQIEIPFSVIVIDDFIDFTQQKFEVVSFDFINNSIIDPNTQTVHSVQDLSKFIVIFDSINEQLHILTSSEHITISTSTQFTEFRFSFGFLSGVQSNPNEVLKLTCSQINDINILVPEELEVQIISSSVTGLPEVNIGDILEFDNNTQLINNGKLKSYLKNHRYLILGKEPAKDNPKTLQDLGSIITNPLLVDSEKLIVNVPEDFQTGQEAFDFLNVPEIRNSKAVIRFNGELTNSEVDISGLGDTEWLELEFDCTINLEDDVLAGPDTSLFFDFKITSVNDVLKSTITSSVILGDLRGTLTVKSDQPRSLQLFSFLHLSADLEVKHYGTETLYDGVEEPSGSSYGSETTNQLNIVQQPDIEIILNQPKNNKMFGFQYRVKDQSSVNVIGTRHSKQTIYLTNCPDLVTRKYGDLTIYHADNQVRLASVNHEGTIEFVPNSIGGTFDLNIIKGEFNKPMSYGNITIGGAVNIVSSEDSIFSEDGSYGLDIKMNEQRFSGYTELNNSRLEVKQLKVDSNVEFVINKSILNAQGQRYGQNTISVNKITVDGMPYNDYLKNPYDQLRNGYESTVNLNLILTDLDPEGV